MKYITHNQWSGNDKFVEFYNSVVTEDWDKIIIFCQNEWEWFNHEPEHWRLLQEHCRTINKPIHVVTGAAEKDFPVSIDNVNVEYWPTAWFGRTFVHSIKANGDKTFINPLNDTSYKYHFFNFNHRPKSHRCKVIDQLAKHDLFKNGLVSIHGSEVYSGAQHEGWSMYPWKHFQYKPMDIDHTAYVSDPHLRMFSITDAHKNSFCQLVSETTDRAYFISEKTIMPMIAGKPFLVASRQGFHQLLAELGFVLYDEIFDYTFDSVVNEDDRYSLLVDNINRIAEVPLSDLPSITKNLASKIIHNRNRVRELVYDTEKYPSLVKEVLEHYKTTGEELDHLLVSLHSNEEMFQYYDW